MSKPITCPKGHPGPFRYVEAIEVWREVTSANSQRIRIHGEWRTGEGFNEGLPGSDYLLCRAPVGEGICGEEFPIPDGVELEFE